MNHGDLRTPRTSVVGVCQQLTGTSKDKCLFNGNTWKESEVRPLIIKESEEDGI